MVMVVSFAVGLALFLLDALVMTAMARALLGGGGTRGKGFVLGACSLRLLAMGAVLYAALVLLALSPLWLVAGALAGLIVFSVALVANPHQNFSLFSNGKLR